MTTHKEALVSKIDDEFMAALGRGEHLDCYNAQPKEQEQNPRLSTKYRQGLSDGVNLVLEHPHRYSGRFKWPEQKSLKQMTDADFNDALNIGQPEQEPVAGLDRCEFDDECDFCKAPEGGVFTRLIHNAEDTTEAEFYICGACVHTAINQYTTPPQRKPLNEWQPIETAPKGILGYSWMLLAWGPEEDKNVCYGMRHEDKFYAAPSFYCMNQDRKYQQREIEINPTHWMPVPSAPIEAAHGIKD